MKFEVGDHVRWRHGGSGNDKFWGKTGIVVKLLPDDRFHDLLVELDKEIPGLAKRVKSTFRNLELVGEPFRQELAEVYASLGVNSAPARTSPNNDVAMLLLGYLTGHLLAEGDDLPIRLAKVEPAVDANGNYLSHFTVTTRSGSRIRVQVTPEEGP